jgi:hypothetical protein
MKNNPAVEDLISTLIEQFQGAGLSQDLLCRFEKNISLLDAQIRAISSSGSERDLQACPELSLESLRRGTVFLGNRSIAFVSGLLLQSDSHPVIFGHLPKSGGSSFWHYLAHQLMELNEMTGARFNILDAHMYKSDNDMIFSRFPACLGHCEMSLANEMINSAPGKAVVHVHFCGPEIGAPSGSSTILIYRDPAKRIKSAFKQFIREQQDLKEIDSMTFWDAPLGAGITPWLSGNYIDDRSKRFIFPFGQLSKSKGVFQAFFLGAGIPCYQIPVFSDTVTAGNRRLEENLESALQNQEFSEQLEAMAIQEAEAWKALGIPSSWTGQ